MKNSKEYAEKIKKLHRTLKRGAKKVTPETYGDPIEAIIYAILSEKVTERQAQAALKKSKKHFVDLNDLRVARPDEISDLYGKESDEIRETGLTLAKVLFAVFDKHHEMTLSSLKEVGKRQARQDLEEMNGMTHFAMSYCLLTALDAHAIPVTEQMVEYLKANDLVDPKADAASIEGFLAKQISAKDAMEFYSLLRQTSESASSKKATSKKTTKKKSVKKKAALKTTTKVTKKVTKKTTTKTASKKTKKK